MSRDIERALVRMTPRDPEPDLKARVLAAVGAILADDAFDNPQPRRIRPGLIAAAALVASLLLNYAVSMSLDRRLTRLLGPRQAADLGVMAGSPVGSDRDAQPYVVRLLELIRQASGDLEEIRYETPEAEPQVDRDLRGNLDRRPVDGQRLLRLGYGNRA